MKRNIDFDVNKKKFQGDIVYDGIVDIEEYYSSPLKLLWILKDPNSPDDSDWDMRDALSDLKNKNGRGLKYGWANTFTPIVYTTYGIFNKVSWEDMGNFYEDQSMIDILKKVAYINVKKVPGVGESDWNEMKSYYKENKRALHEQIELINPEIIIFGNTLKFFDSDFLNLFGELNKNKENNSLHIYENKEHLLLYAYHPNNRKLTQNEYCNLIINAVSEWKLKYNK